MSISLSLFKRPHLFTGMSQIREVNYNNRKEEKNPNHKTVQPIQFQKPMKRSSAHKDQIENKSASRKSEPVQLDQIRPAFKKSVFNSKDQSGEKSPSRKSKPVHPDQIQQAFKKRFFNPKDQFGTLSRGIAPQNEPLFPGFQQEEPSNIWEAGRMICSLVKEKQQKDLEQQNKLFSSSKVISKPLPLTPSLMRAAAKEKEKSQSKDKDITQPKNTSHRSKNKPHQSKNPLQQNKKNGIKDPQKVQPIVK